MPFNEALNVSGLAPWLNCTTTLTGKECNFSNRLGEMTVHRLSEYPVRAKPRLRRIAASTAIRNFLVAIVMNSTVKLKAEKE
jgi:hypothetical protein